MTARARARRAALGAATAVWLAAGTAQAQVVARPDRVGDRLKFALPIAAASWSLYQGDTEGLKEFGASFAVSSLGTEGLKRADHEPRPDGTGQGFVSGHASSTFVSAAYLHRRYGLDVAWPAYALATLTAYERVDNNHHFTRQVARGAAIGIGSAVLFTKPLSGTSQVAVLPADRGLVLQYTAVW